MFLLPPLEVFQGDPQLVRNELGRVVGFVDPGAGEDLVPTNFWVEPISRLLDEAADFFVDHVPFPLRLK